MTDTANLEKTPLYNLHVELGGKMVPFAGYAMPVQYDTGIVAEHKHCREAAALFDVSHMGQGRLIGERAAEGLEKIVPGLFLKLKPGRQRYTVLTNEQGGIIDDLMVSNQGDCLGVVVNAACKNNDFAHLEKHLADYCEIIHHDDLALLALQGPKAGEVMERVMPETKDMIFMDAKLASFGGVDCFVSRSGYTGEDGFEISVPAAHAEKFARHLLSYDEVKPAGLGARDSLRLEAGLCLYGNDIDKTTTPVEANIPWVIGKRRREEGGFLGADVILKQLENGTDKKLVAIKPEGRAPARAHTKILNTDGQEIGEITSGGFSPTLGEPIALGYVNSDYTDKDTKLLLAVRKKQIPARVVALPFVEHRYKRG